MNGTESYRRLSLAELNDRKAKGLCFHCDKKFEPGHDCRKKKIFIMMGEEKEEDSATESEELAVIWEEDDNGATNPTVPEAKISIQAMSGSTGNCTLKLLGAIKGRTVSILVDSGSTHNFIPQALVKQLQLTTAPCNSFDITVANGERILCSTVLEEVQWQMSNQKFSSRMNVIPLGGYDIILGVKWMSDVSPVTFDYKDQSITINWQNQKIKLQQASREPIVQLVIDMETPSKFHQEEAYFLVQLTAMDGEHGEFEDLAPEYQELLHSYADIFCSSSDTTSPKIP